MRNMKNAEREKNAKTNCRISCCCRCCLLQMTLSCQVTNTSRPIDFQSKYINSVVNVVASGAQILSKIANACMTVSRSWNIVNNMRVRRRYQYSRQL